MVTSVKKLNFHRIYTVLFVLCSMIGVTIFSSNSYAESVPVYFQPEVIFRFSVSRVVCNATTCWFQYGNEYSGTATLTNFDSSTGVGTYNFNLGNSWVSWCTGYHCQFNIIYIGVNTRVLSNGQYITPDFSVNDYLHIKITSPYEFYTGNGYDINFNYGGQGYYWNVAGGDVMLDSWSNNPTLCIAQGIEKCTTHYSSDAIAGSTTYSAYMDLDHSALSNNTLFYFGEWPYNTNQDGLIIATYYSYYSVFDWDGSSSSFNLDISVWTDGEFHSVSTGTDLEDEIAQQNQIMQDHANEGLDSWGGLNFNGFQIPWIFSAWFSLFISNDCANIPNLANMLNTTNNVVCSPWANTGVRAILTPIFSMLASLLAFGFIIRWLSNSHDLGTDDLGDIWYGK